MDSEAVFHFVLANTTHLQAEADAAGLTVPYQAVAPYKARWDIMLAVARGWLDTECVGKSDVWIQYGKTRLIVAQFENPDDAFAFKIRFG